MLIRYSSFLVAAILSLTACSPSPQKSPPPVPAIVTPQPEPEKTVEPSPIQPETVVVPEPLQADEPQALPEPTTITIVATGDMMLGGTGTEFYERDNYDYAFVNVRDILLNADIFIGNLEAALTNSEEVLVDKKYRFKTPPVPVAAALSRAGMDVAILANNHSMDYGYAGLAETRWALHSEGVKTIGAGSNLAEARRAAIINVAEKRVGFLAYSNTFPEEFWAQKNRPGTAFGHQHQIVEDVKVLKRQGVDHVLVSFHWGREGKTELREYQPILGRAAIDAGADIVIGHHPHILQAVEQYKHGVIFYSLGNFTFGSYSKRATVSAIARITLQEEHRKAELIPINVLNHEVLFQPKLLQGEEAMHVVNALQNLSSERGTNLQVAGDSAVLEWSADSE